MNIDILRLHISTATILAAVAAGVGVVLILLILSCCCWCCRQKDKGKRTTHIIPAQNHLEAAAKGKQHGKQAQQRQQQNNSAGHHHHVHPNNHIPPPVASPLQKPASRSLTHLSSHSSTGSTNSTSPLKRSSTPPQLPSSYLSSEKSNLSGSESSRPLSSFFSYGSSQTVFNYNELAKATDGFSEANLLGEGGFGYVHKRVLPNGKEVAVKSLRANSGQGETEFEAEVEIISRVHHRHLVSLVGYCITGSHRLLVYEFVPNNTLEFHLYGKGKPNTLDWPTRLKVSLGSAKGFAYLHEDCQPRIIHRDIKAANILLDNNFQAKVADFGLAKLTAGADTHVSTRVMGTLGYLAPEYASSGRLTEKSDVYSFGVMLLELITGRRPLDRAQKENNLVEWAKPLLLTAMDDNFDNLVDPRLKFSYKHSEMVRMVVCAANCVRKSARHRPLMSQVVRALEGNMSLNNLNEGGITPGLSLVERYDSVNSEHSGSQYRSRSKGHTSTSDYSRRQYKTRGVSTAGLDSKNMVPPNTEYVSSDYDGTTSEYGVHASSSSSEGQTTATVLDSKEVHINQRHL